MVCGESLKREKHEERGGGESVKGGEFAFYVRCGLQGREEARRLVDQFHAVLPDSPEK